MEFVNVNKGPSMENLNNVVINNSETDETIIEDIGGENSLCVEKKSEKELEDEPKDKGYSEKELKESLDIVNSLLKKHNSHAEYAMHDKFKNVIMIKIVDTDSGQVLQEVPPKKILDMIAKMCEMVGIMVDKKA